MNPGRLTSLTVIILEVVRKALNLQASEVANIYWKANFRGRAKISRRPYMSITLWRLSGEGVGN